MKTEGAIEDSAVFRRLVENDDESAAVAILLHLCRHSPELRHWLWEDFGRSAKVRAKFGVYVNSRCDPPVSSFSELTVDDGPMRREQSRLKREFSPGIYGGLTWNQVVTALGQHQAGSIDLGAYLLAQEWQNAKALTPLLMLAGTDLLCRVLPAGRRRMLKHTERALSLLKRSASKAHRRAAIGYSDWWKIQVLLYVLRHPQPSYRTRELRTHLASLGLDISSKYLRRFCGQLGLRRDMKAGRPRVKKAAA